MSPSCVSSLPVPGKKSVSSLGCKNPVCRLTSHVTSRLPEGVRHCVCCAVCTGKLPRKLAPTGALCLSRHSCKLPNHAPCVSFFYTLHFFRSNIKPLLVHIGDWYWVPPHRSKWLPGSYKPHAHKPPQPLIVMWCKSPCPNQHGKVPPMLRACCLVDIRRRGPHACPLFFFWWHACIRICFFGGGAQAFIFLGFGVGSPIKWELKQQQTIIGAVFWIRAHSSIFGEHVLTWFLSGSRFMILRLGWQQKQFTPCQANICFITNPFLYALIINICWSM